MTSEPDDPVDRRLCEAFAPDPAGVERVARNALAAAPSRRRRRLGVSVTAAVAVVVVLSGLVWYQRGKETAPSWTGPAPDALELTGSIVDGVLVVHASDHDIVIVGGGERDERPPDGYGIVLVEGEIR